MTRLSAVCAFVFTQMFTVFDINTAAPADNKQSLSSGNLSIVYSVRSMNIPQTRKNSKENIDSALLSLKKAYRADELRPSGARPEILKAMGKLYLSAGFSEQNKITDADEQFYLNELLLLGADKITPLVSSKIHYALYQAASASSKFSEAFSHYQSYRTISDSLNNAGTAYRLRTVYNAAQIKQQKESAFMLPGHTDSGLKSKVIIALIALTLVTGLIFMVTHKRKKSIGKRLVAIQRQLLEKDESLADLNTDTGRMISEKESLITEMHHNVKNSLQIIISLLSSQSAYLKNETAVAAIDQSRSRLYTMSLIYQKLYGTAGVELIEMEAYINELVSFLTESFQPTSRNIQFVTHIEGLQFETGMATQVGLFLNEAITNALKFAFLKKSSGQITITLIQIGDNITVKVSDNGIGLSGAYKGLLKDAVGISLMRSLSSQLKGLFSMQSKDGLTVKVEFPVLAKQTAAGLQI